MSGNLAISGTIEGADSSAVLNKILLSGDFSLYEELPAALHNCFYRGKNLTTYFNSGEMSTNIANGTFKDIYPGDYIIKSVTINGTTYTDVKWIVMDLDYHLHAGDSKTTTHHLVLMPETILGARQMNTTNTTEGGYLGSDMWTTHIPLAVTGIETAFGTSHVLSHREFLTNAMDVNQRSKAYYGWSGAASNWTWTTVKVNLCNENMVYGAPIMSSSAYDTGECIKQLAAFSHNHGLRCSKRQWWWLRAVSHSTAFAGVHYYGYADYYDASYSGGPFRPYFLLR